MSLTAIAAKKIAATTAHADALRRQESTRLAARYAERDFVEDLAANRCSPAVKRRFIQAFKTNQKANIRVEKTRERLVGILDCRS